MKFRMVDRIVAVQEHYIETVKAVSFEEFNLLEPWGRRGPLPESLILQVAVESAALLVAHRSGWMHTGVLDEMEGVRFERESRPGDVLRCRVSADATGFAFAIAADTPVCSGVVRLREMSLKDCYDRDAFVLAWRR
jgi:hypothetical protein